MGQLRSGVSGGWRPQPTWMDDEAQSSHLPDSKYWQLKSLSQSLLHDTASATLPSWLLALKEVLPSGFLRCSEKEGVKLQSALTSPVSNYRWPMTAQRPARREKRRRTMRVTARTRSECRSSSNPGRPREKQGAVGEEPMENALLCPREQMP